MMKYGIDHLVDGAVQAKRKQFMPEVEKVVKEMSGFEEDEEMNDWPDAEELDVDNSQQDMDVDEDSGEADRDDEVKPEVFIPSFVELQSESQGSSSPPFQIKSIIQQLFEPIVKREDDKSLTPTKISIQLNMAKQLKPINKEEEESQTGLEFGEEDKIETVDMEEDSRPSSKNSISDIQLPSSPPPATLPPLPPLTTIKEEEPGSRSISSTLGLPLSSGEEPPIVVKVEWNSVDQEIEQEPVIAEVQEIEREGFTKDRVLPLEYLSDVSSVHTSDLSDFDNRISPESEDEKGQPSPRKKSPAKVSKVKSKKSKDEQGPGSGKRWSVESQQQNLDSRPSTSSSTGRRERKINPKYASDEYSSIYNRSKGRQTVEEDISSDEDFEAESLASKSTAGKSTPVQDEISNDGSIASVNTVKEGEDHNVEEIPEANVQEGQIKSQLKNVRRKTSKR